MPLRDVTVRLGLNAAPYVAGIKSAQAATVGLGTTLTKTAATGSKSAAVLGSTFGVVGIAAGLAGAAMVRAAADFDQGMSNIKATGSDAVRNIGALRQAALDAGAATKYSATEAAGGVEALAKAGVSSADILGGGLKGALSLAAAGNLDVAGSAEAAASALNQFELSGKDVPHIADLLAAAAGKAQGEVSDMADALNNVGVIAHQSGANIEETTGVLASFASAGQVGSEAGTQLRSMLMALQTPSAQAAAKMKELKISAYDAKGEFVGFANLAGQLRDGPFGKLTPEDRAAAGGIIFGTYGVKAANLLYAEGVDGIDKWTNAVDDSGFAAKNAATKMDNLKGDFETFKGSVDTLLIQGGEGSQGPLRGFVQGATDLTNLLIGARKEIGKLNLSRFTGPGLMGSAHKDNPFGVFGDLFNLGRAGSIGRQANVERKVVTKFQAIGANGSVRDAARVARAANLTPKEVRVVLRLLGWSDRNILRVNAALKQTKQVSLVRAVMTTMGFSPGKIQAVTDALKGAHSLSQVKARLTLAGFKPAQIKAILGLLKDLGAVPPAKPKADLDDKATPKLSSLTTMYAGFASAADIKKTITITTVKKTVTQPAGGGAIPFNEGGRAWGAMSGPGGDTDDRIPAWLSDGEHVLTASDVRMLGGQDAVYRMRAEAQAGALRFASGGAVPTSNQLAIERLEAELEIKRLKTEINEAKKTPAGGTKVSSQEKALLALQLSEAQAHLARIVSGQEGLMHDYAETLAGDLGAFDLSSAFGGDQSPWQSSGSGGGIASWAAGRLSKLKAFAAKLVELKKRGLGGMLLAEIAAMGIDGGTRAANSLLSGPASDITGLQSTYDQIQSFQTGIGSFLAGSTPTVQVANFQITDWQTGMGQIELNIANGVNGAMVGAIR